MMGELVPFGSDSQRMHKETENEAEDEKTIG